MVDLQLVGGKLQLEVLVVFAFLARFVGGEGMLGVCPGV